MRYWRNSSLRPLFVFALTALIIIFISLQHSYRSQIFSYDRPEIYDYKDIVGPHDGLEDVFVVMRTGASEIARALPVQLDTTLSRVPHYAIFSDLEQDFQGHHVIDVLAEISDEVKRSNEDFEYYYRLKEHGLQSFTEAELAAWPGRGDGQAGNKANPGWKLDKWKFLPMVAKALEMRPEAKWFVFVEADTYVLWPSLARWLSTLNASKKYYIGRRLKLGDSKFAYGGNGIVISAPAMRKITELRAEDLNRYDKLTAKKWAGDAVLGVLMKDAGIKLTDNASVLRGEAPSAMDYSVKVRHSLLCSHSPLSFHHITPAEIRTTWETIENLRNESSTLPRYIDIFKAQVLPFMSPKKDNWDNFAKVDPNPYESPRANDSFDECRVACERKERCRQFSYQPDYCQISASILLGHASMKDEISTGEDWSTTAIQSGWMIQRILKFLDEC